MDNDNGAIRELFIDELAEVSGGGPVEELIRELTGDGGATTMACCEEGQDNCCSPSEPW